MAKETFQKSSTNVLFVHSKLHKAIPIAEESAELEL